MTPSARSVAAYIEKHYDAVVFMTASQVAHEAGVSQGSVSRFCTAMGYSGFSDFQTALRETFGPGTNVSQRISHYAQDAGGERRRAHERALASDVESILKLRDVLESPEYRQLVERLARCERLILVSSRISATMLPYFEYTLNKIRPDVELVLPGGQQWDYLALRDPNRTVVLVTAFPRYSAALLDKVRELHAKGFTVLALTDSHVSPVCSLAEVSLCLPVVVSATFDNYAALASFFNVVLEDIVPMLSGVSERIDAIDALEQSSHVYDE